MVNDSRWSARRGLYKFGTVIAYINLLVYALAFAIPLWLNPAGETILGLWASGKGDSSSIDDVKATGFDDGKADWFEAVRGLWVGGMAFYVLGVAFNFYENFCAYIQSRDYGISAVLILFSGLCGAAGVITFAIEMEENDDSKHEYMWGFMLACIASGIAILMAIILLITKEFDDYHDAAKTSRTADYVYAHKQQRPYAPEYNNPTYRGDELPLANGTPYNQPFNHSPYSMGSMYRPGGDNGYTSKYDQGSAYYPYGYRDPRPGNRLSMAESADLSNGFTHDIVQHENTLGQRGDYGRSSYTRGEMFYNGSSRPY